MTRVIAHASNRVFEMFETVWNNLETVALNANFTLNTGPCFAT